jgi:hypothetical protein
VTSEKDYSKLNNFSFGFNKKSEDNSKSSNNYSSNNNQINKKTDNFDLLGSAFESTTSSDKKANNQIVFFIFIS